MIVSLKFLAPFILYTVSLILIIHALSGRPQWLLSFLVILLPLRNVIDKLHAFPLGKDLVDIFILVLLVSMLLSTLREKKELFTKSPINVISAVLIIYTFISLLQGSDYLNNYIFFDLSDPRVQSWKNFCTLPLLFLIILNSVRDKKWVWRIFLLMCITMVFMDIYLLRQISWFTNIESRAKIHGTFVHLGPNEVAAFYNQYTLILLGVYFFMKKGLPKLLLFGLIIANLFCVIFLFSRAAYISLTIGLFLMFLFKKRILLIPLLLIAIFWQMILPDKVIERIEMTTNEYGELDKSSSNRLHAWKGSLELFSESPITGVGYGVFQYMGFGLGDTHNIYLKLLSEQGLIGLTIFLILVLCFFLQGVRLYSRGDKDGDNMSRGLGLGFAICIIVLMINNIFGNCWTYMELSSYLWIFAGLVNRLNIIAAREERFYSKKEKDPMQLLVERPE